MQPPAPVGPPSPGIPPATPPYPASWLPPPQPPPRDRTALIVVIVVAVVIVGTVLASAILYVLVSGLIDNPGNGRLVYVVFSEPQAVNGNVTFMVAAMSAPEPSGNLRMNLRVGSNTGASTGLPANGSFRPTPVGPATYRVYGMDFDGDGALSQGDSFLVTGDGVPLPQATAFTFSLLWMDGRVISALGWSTP